MNEQQFKNELEKLTEDKNRTYMYIIYGLFILAVVFKPLAIIGAVFAFMKREELSVLAQTHCNYLIKTFIVAFIGSFLIFVPVIFWFIFAWYVYRVASGFQNFYGNREVNGESWFK
ncbi:MULTISPECIES: DUF4870 family protein [Basfia]|uniref:Uncharacterized protein n=2 Tax=Basfia TaxID=697331 RepID=Q65R46_MANSM|nr:MULTISPECIES: hypothetical protein [Basfia]AAU38564.1 unknown [[Mannheimia] succiniciproducens MBEL55E]QIM69165.1 hypothetical protein A4G13_07060 [Basfia succiniciproducens]SCY09048.1 Uncharacterized membrane protein [Basfia succiniciproducens]SEP58147.1 Uncharacterized membrane protein [Basfia succiniciproducens]